MLGEAIDYYQIKSVGEGRRINRRNKGNCAQKSPSKQGRKRTRQKGDEKKQRRDKGSRKIKGSSLNNLRPMLRPFFLNYLKASMD